MVELGEPDKGDPSLESLTRKLDVVRLKKEAAAETLSVMQGAKVSETSTHVAKAQRSRLETDMIHKQAGLASSNVIINAIRLSRLSR